MSKQLKTLVTDALKSRYEGIDEACSVNITSLTVAETMQVRRALAVQNMRVTVVKNSLARRAFAGGPLEPLGASLEGSCALVTGGDSIIDVARALVKLAGELPKFELKRGLLAGETDLVSVAELATYRGLREVLGEVASLISGPGRRVAGCIAGPQGRVAGCIKAIADREEAVAA